MRIVLRFGRPVTMQLKFLQYYENVEVPQIPFLDRVLQLPVVLQRRAKAGDSTVQFFDVVYVPTVVR